MNLQYPVYKLPSSSSSSGIPLARIKIINFAKLVEQKRIGKKILNFSDGRVSSIYRAVEIR